MEDFVASAALLAAHLTQQCEQAAANQRAAASVLEDAAAGVARHTAAGRDALLRATTTAVHEALTGQLDATMAHADAASQRLGHLLAHLERTQAGLDSRARLLGGGALLALVVGAVAIIGASSYVAHLNLARAERASVRAEVLEALQQVTITACEGRPCIKLEDGLRRWPSNSDYVFVDAPQAMP
ncbi:hypothetical protein [Luteimonas sp. 3794]|uniref:hypothetical protein n=1 Tax=Luteimonas sp. 3794 TaxID=2817730 RepID=UPI00286A60FD|nr:hypothetical protein [Luteimonas sp. 3794]